MTLNRISPAATQCKRYVDAFGAQGAVWFAEGLSFEAAAKRRAVELTADAARLRAELSELRRRERAQALPLSDNMRRFAGSIKLSTMGN